MAATPPICDFGWPAVDARLPGVDGLIHSIFDQAGPKGLVVAFICNHCPYVKSVIGRIVRDAIDLKAHGIGFVAISANDADAYPRDSFDNMKRFASQNALPFSYLYDEDQSVAKAYGAVCTPDFFGFNKDMKLQYRGRLDASRKEIGPADLRRDLYEAMVMVALFGKGPAEQQPSIGCGIKWKVSAFPA
ncbi:thioredoxin family protein [Ensifer aridi]|uniref:thioredoxin family protein n=1 Tax=Ensifer aridi TaxID=1708715 RepID=UPI000614E9CA|nr:thioredoxin family protein [Ensifer aridi]